MRLFSSSLVMRTKSSYNDLAFLSAASSFFNCNLVAVFMVSVINYTAKIQYISIQNNDFCHVLILYCTFYFFLVVYIIGVARRQAIKKALISQGPGKVWLEKQKEC